MAKKNTNFTLGLNRQELVAQATALGKRNAGKENTRRLERYIVNQTKPKVEKQTRLGLNRQELIQSATLFGKSEKAAKRSSTERLEQFLTNKLGGKGTKIPEFTDRQKRDISDSSKDFGIQDALHMVSYRIGRLTGNQDESNYLRLTIGRAFNAYYEGQVTSRMLDELMSRIDTSDRNEVISGVSKHDYYYQEIFDDYARELEQEQSETR